MSYTLNDKIKNLVPYEPISGTFNIRLDANECTLNYNDEFKQLVFDAVNSIDFNRYPDPTCINIRKSFADFYGIDYKNVTVGNGSDELLFIIESAFLEKGDSLLVATPDFSMYEFYSSIAEVNCVKYVKNTELNIDVDKLINIVNSNNIGLVLFSNPCNPTGQGVCKNDIVKLLNSVNALVVLDEAYMDFWSDEESLIQDVDNYSNLIVLRTASKAMGSAALRLGFAVSNITITNALTAVKSPYNVNTLSQTIGASVYKNKKFLKNQINTIVENTNLLYNGLVDISNNTEDFVVYPTKTNFVFIKTSFGKDLWNFLKDNSVAIRYMGDYIRITAGTKEEIDTTVKLIDRFISER